MSSQTETSGATPAPAVETPPASVVEPTAAVQPPAATLAAPIPAAQPQAAPPPLPPGYTYAAVRRDPKSPFAALLLSILFPGLGQVYNGQLSKALIIFCVWAGCLYTMIEVNPLPWVFVMAFTTLFSYVDAWRTATLINARAAGGDLTEELDVADSPLWGGALVLLGVVLLLHNVGWVDLREMQRYWPVLLIVAGGATLWNSLKRQQAREADGEARSEG